LEHDPENGRLFSEQIMLDQETRRNGLPEGPP
jgi:hypothetical protein